MKLTVLALIALGNIALAGGDLSPSAQQEIKKDSLWSVGVGLVAGQVHSNNCEDKTYGLIAKVDYDFSTYIGVEARAFKTNWEYEGGKLEHLGLFMKPQYQVNKEFNLYALAGYGKTSFGNKRNFSDTGLAYGIGGDYVLNEEFSLFADYERLLHDAGDYDLDALSFGVSYEF